MRRVTKYCLIATCLAMAAWFPQGVQAQVGVGGAAVGFKNDLKTPIIIQGHTMVDGMAKRGMAIPILPGQVKFDFNVPAGVRFYTICDANQPNIILFRDSLAVMNNDLRFAVRGIPPKVVVVPVPVP